MKDKKVFTKNISILKEMARLLNEVRETSVNDMDFSPNDKEIVTECDSALEIIESLRKEMEVAVKMYIK